MQHVCILLPGMEKWEACSLWQRQALWKRPPSATSRFRARSIQFSFEIGQAGVRREPIKEGMGQVQNQHPPSNPIPVHRWCYLWARVESLASGLRRKVSYIMFWPGVKPSIMTSWLPNLNSIQELSPNEPTPYEPLSYMNIYAWAYVVPVKSFSPS